MRILLRMVLSIDGWPEKKFKIIFAGALALVALALAWPARPY